MTNGEKIQTILDVDRDCTEVHGENGTMTFTVTQDFWNAEYKEPTAKNDFLGVDKTFYEQIMEYCKEHFLVLVDKDVWDDAEKALTTKNNLAVDCIDRAKAQTKIEMNASRYTIAKEREGMGQVEWSDYLIKVSDAVDIIRNLPPVTPQHSSGLEKNSKKLEKNFGELDCISRAYLLDDSKYHTVFNDDTGNFEDVVYREDIEKAPPVTPIRPKGHWIKTPKAVMDEGYMWYCDKCNHEVYQDSSRSYPSENFCPNCGSDNREVEE